MPFSVTNSPDAAPTIRLRGGIIHFGMHLYEHTDYRPWLKERAEEIKDAKPYFSYRFIASKLGINGGLVARVFNGQAHLSLKHVAGIAKLYGLKGSEAEYFEELVRFGRAKTQKDWDSHFTRMQTIRGAKFRTVSDDQIEYYASWHHNALRSLLSIVAFKGQNHKRLGAQLVPPVDGDTVRESLELLRKLGLAEPNREGIWEVPDRFVSTGEKWKAAMIHRFQKESIRLSGEALDTVPKERRDVSSMTLPFSLSMLDVARERLRAFRQEMLALSRECDNEDCVMQLNLQLFPVAVVASSNAESAS